MQNLFSLAAYISDEVGKKDSSKDPLDIGVLVAKRPKLLPSEIERMEENKRSNKGGLMR